MMESEEKIMDNRVIPSYVSIMTLLQSFGLFCSLDQIVSFWSLDYFSLKEVTILTLPVVIRREQFVRGAC